VVRRKDKFSIHDGKSWRAGGPTLPPPDPDGCDILYGGESEISIGWRHRPMKNSSILQEAARTAVLIAISF